MASGDGVTFGYTWSRWLRLFGKLSTKKKANQVKSVDTKLVYLPYPHDNDKVYDSNMTKNDLKHDKLAKYLIDNSISDEIKVRLDFRKLSAFQIWKALEKSNKKSDEKIYVN